MNINLYYNTWSQENIFSIRQLAHSAKRISIYILKTTNMTRAESFAKTHTFKQLQLFSFCAILFFT